MDWFCSFYHPLTATFSKSKNKKKKPWLSRYLCVSRLPNSLLLSFRSQKLNFAQHFPLITISTSAHTEPSFALSLPLCQLLLPCSPAPGVALPLSKPEYCPLPTMQPVTQPELSSNAVSNFLVILEPSCQQGWEEVRDPAYSLHHSNPSFALILQWFFQNLNRMWCNRTNTLLNAADREQSTNYLKWSPRPFLVWPQP